MKLSAAQAKTMFPKVCTGAGLPTPDAEIRFHPVRRWRLDYGWPAYRVGLEVEGGVFTQGRHTRGAGALGDMAKYNELACMGWRLLRVVPRQLCTAETLDWIKRALEAA